MKPSASTATRSSERSISPDAGIAERPAKAGESLRATIRGDYRRHGSSALNAAFLSLCIYRFGRWGLHRRTAIGRKLASRVYGFGNLFVANITKIWIPPQVTIGRDFHIVHHEGSLSIHPDTIIGDRLGVMHNVTIGTNMGDGAPVIGDDVFIGVNSVVLGAITVGDRVRIGANTTVTMNVPSDSVVIGSPGRIVPRLGMFK
ncbi:serine O-acetyltransferase [Sphingobium bisphenolivorans]|uniref:serine O-acetyltransferase n=1 Tax=Sphingobium bisphenolivorans TaxID=1335760 RepID=UPI0003B2F80D|nr:serine acetyltransferase [Sphingobium bisphenolivorans]